MKTLMKVGREKNIIRRRLESLRTVEVKRIMHSSAMHSIKCMAYGVLLERGRML